MGKVAERFNQLAADPHLREEVRRLRRAVRTLHGDATLLSVEELTRQVAGAIVTLETTDVDQTHGGPLVVRRGVYGYDLLIDTCVSILPTHMTPAGPAMKAFRSGKPGPLRAGEMEKS